MLREFQSQAIEKLAQNRDCHLVVCAPTGYGKSRIFEELIQNHGLKTLLISPLKALNHQHETLLKPWLQKRVLVHTPEALLHRAAIDAIRQFRPDLWVVDECHTLADWGLSFRPTLRKLYTLFHDNAPRRSLWLSATLPDWIRRDLEAGLKPKTLDWLDVAPREFSKISIASSPAALRLGQLIKILETEAHSGLVFCQTRSSCERVFRSLCVSSSGETTALHCYHAGLGSESRRSIEKKLQEPTHQKRVIVATSAFGMGMNLKDLTWVIFFEPPRSMIELNQVLGRASRSPYHFPKALIFFDHHELFKNSDAEIQSWITQSI